MTMTESETASDDDHTDRPVRASRGAIADVRWISTGAHAVLRQLADVVLPPLCVSCGTPLADHGRLCPSCWAQVDFIRPPLCERLGIPLPFDAGPGSISAAAAANPPNYDRARAVAHYDRVMRRLIHDFKYRDRQNAQALFVGWLTEIARPLVTERTILLPVPLSRMRLFSRRFNQAAILTSGVARELKCRHCPDALQRVKRTRTQVGLSPSERQRNVQGAFSVPARRQHHVNGQDVILVDDVITSGATIEACTRALKRAGAIRVDVIALARVVHPVRPTI